MGVLKSIIKIENIWSVYVKSNGNANRNLEIIVLVQCRNNAQNQGFLYFHIRLFSFSCFQTSLMNLTVVKIDFESWQFRISFFINTWQIGHLRYEYATSYFDLQYFIPVDSRMFTPQMIFMWIIKKFFKPEMRPIVCPCSLSSVLTVIELLKYSIRCRHTSQRLRKNMLWLRRNMAETHNDYNAYTSHFVVMNGLDCQCWNRRSSPQIWNKLYVFITKVQSTTSSRVLLWKVNSCQARYPPCIA